MNGKRMCVAEIAMIGIILALAPVARAQNTFTTANGYWDVSGNWSLGHAPTNGEDVSVGVNARITNATATVERACSPTAPSSPSPISPRN